MSTTIRTDVPVTGPLLQTDSIDGRFILMARRHSDLYYYALMAQKNTVYDPINQFVPCYGGIASYVSLTNIQQTNGSRYFYEANYFTYSIARSSGMAVSNTFGQTDLTVSIKVYDMTTNSVIGYMTVTNDNLTYDSNATNTITLSTKDPHGYPGRPSIMAGVEYNVAGVSKFLAAPATGVIPSGESFAIYHGAGGLPSGADEAAISDITSIMFVPMSWLDSTCQNYQRSQNSTVIFQCPRSAALSLSAESSKEYYTTYCSASSYKTGTTKGGSYGDDATVCNMTSGKPFYYAVNGGSCGEAWPADYTYVDMTEKTVHATSAYGYTPDGFCVRDTTTDNIIVETNQEFVDDMIARGIVTSGDCPSCKSCCPAAPACDSCCKTCINCPDCPTCPPATNNIPSWVWIIVIVLAIFAAIVTIALIVKMMSKPKCPLPPKPLPTKSHSSTTSISHALQ